jgi:hypothetical protein
MSRLFQILLITSTIAFSWLGMQAVHELGHVLGAWAGGETVNEMVLHPLVISRTDASHDRHPLLVVWGGPILGSFLPLVLLGISRLIRSGLFYLFQFFAGFCLIANGAYVGVGSFSGVGDAGDLMRYGAPRWTLIVFGLACVPIGLSLWNGLGTHYGLGRSNGEVDRSAALGTLGLALVVVLVEVVTGSR